MILIYICLLPLVMTMHQLPFSDNYKASWIYYSAPIEKPGEILSGGFKSILVKFSIPLIFISIFILFIWGIKSFDDIIFGFLNIILFLFLLSFVYIRCFPFSKKVSNVIDISDKIPQTLLPIFLLIFLSFLHYFVLTKYNSGVIIANAILFTIILVLSKKYKSTSRNQM